MRRLLVVLLSLLLPTFVMAQFSPGTTRVQGLDGGYPVAVTCVSGCSGSSSAAVQPVSGIDGGVPVGVNIVSVPFDSRSDTFTTTGFGTTVNVSSHPEQTFSIQVSGTSAAASAWDIRLESSLDNVHFTQVLDHTNTTGDGVVLSSGSILTPSLYFRSNVVSLTLGSATNVVVTIVGK
jgi:hypothetical protein